MKSAVVVLACVILVNSALFAQEIKKCDGDVIQYAQFRAGKLTKSDMKNFLLTFGKECDNNVELSEFSNEVLFLVLSRQTKLTLKTIEKEETQLDLEAILDDLNAPISDMISVEKILIKAKKIKMESRLKNRIVESLNTAVRSTKP